MTTLDSPSLEAAALQHWQDSLTARHGAEMIANPADLDLEAAHFDEFFDDSARASATRHFWNLACKARHGASFDEQYDAYLELCDLGDPSGACLITLRAQKMVATAPFPVTSAWG